MWKLGVRHPRVFKYIAEYLVGAEDDGPRKIGRGFSEFSTQGIGNLSWSYAKQAQLAVDRQGGSGRLAVYGTSCVDIGENLMKRLFIQLAESAIGIVPEMSPQDMSNTAWAFATLGMVHNGLFDAIAEEVRER